MSKRKKVVTVGLPKAKQNKLLNESCGQRKGPEVRSKLEFNILFISFVNLARYFTSISLGLNSYKLRLRGI